MKKILVLFVLVATLVGLLLGCSSTPNSGITYEEILSGFEQQLASGELADHYQTTRPPATEIQDSNETRHDLVITDKQEDYIYELRVWCDPEGYALGVVLSTTNSELESLAFPTFCLYMCKAMKLSVSDWYGFCETLGLLGGDPSGSTTIDRWRVSALGSESHLDLCAFFHPEP